MKQLIIGITVVLAFHVGNVEAAQWMPLDEAEDRLRIRTNNSPEEGGVLCTSHPGKAGKGIGKDGRRLGFLTNKGCKTVGVGKKVVTFTREDGDIMVLVDDVPGNVKAAQWMPLDEAEDRPQIRTNNGPEEGRVLCTSKPAGDGKGIHKDGRRLGFLNKKGCKTVGASKKVVLFTREDGDIMVLVDEVPAPHDVDQIEHSSVHDGGWYCQLCDEHFDTQQDMDEHAEEMGHTHTDHGDSSSVHDGGWYCQLCDEHFDTQQDMDEHAEEMGHTHTDHGDSSSVHDEGEEHSNDTEFDSAIAFVGCNYWGSGRSGVNGVQVVTWDECHDAAAEGGYEWFGLNWGGHKKEGKGGCHLSNAALPPVDGSQCQEVTDEAGHYLGHSQSMAIYSQGGVSGAKENE